MRLEQELKVMTTLNKLNTIMSIANEVSSLLETELSNCEAKEVENKIRASFKEMAKKRYLDKLLKNVMIPQTPISKISTSNGEYILVDKDTGKLYSTIKDDYIKYKVCSKPKLYMYDYTIKYTNILYGIGAVNTATEIVCGK